MYYTKPRAGLPPKSWKYLRAAIVLRRNIGMLIGGFVAYCVIMRIAGEVVRLPLYPWIFPLVAPAVFLIAVMHYIHHWQGIVSEIRLFEHVTGKMVLPDEIRRRLDELERESGPEHEPSESGR
jgi:hypothetical protein